MEGVVKRRGVLNSSGQDKLMTDGDGRQSVTRCKLTTHRNFSHQTVRQNLVRAGELTGRIWANKKR
ncbi:hypothetical protein BKA56DRAFT_603764 [Ilyonectria sp. MPI-CAGE-AT-0026]|nr:hypothetical protein BKA56DRAFT_603605 [Ilyonectria sp. MPI-CAGE-AT-0026]KAH6954052.1 hypothetical protein BKA56DRAFT_603764 [Ilyonectria sp. MPI-CAGE-AT-0026]